MMRALVHRGPDGQGLWRDPDMPVVLGHNRLAIMDPSQAGAQPMLSASRRYVINFNGEIYNFQDLRRALDRETSAPIAWRGHCDTEVLAETIGACGVETALARIEGMFALAVWDRAERKLWLIRDRIGEKPLYYGEIGATFAFASEVSALRAAFGEQLVLNQVVLSEYLRAGYIPAPHTIYRGILKLPAGHLVCIDVSSGSPVVPPPVSYWSLEHVLPRTHGPRTPRDAVAAATEGEAVLRQAVAERMMGDVPVGAFLSGGIDSSLVVAMMARHSSAPVRTFTISFEDPRYDESRFANQVVAHLGNVLHTQLTVTAADFLALVPRMSAIFGEPFADSSQIPTFLLADLTRRDVSVALSGEGADELFGGYDKYFDAQRVWRLLSRIPVPLRRMVSQLLSTPSVDAWNGLLQYSSSDIPEGRRINGDRIHKLAATLTAADRREFYSLVSGSWRPARDAVLLAEQATRLNAPDFPSLDFIEEMMATDLMSSLPDGILTKVDRATMAVGLESRAPFLAEGVVKFAWSLPIEMKANADQGKLVLRDIVSKYLPPAICNREKKGFSTPLEVWLRGGLRSWVEHLLEPARLEAGGFRPGPVRTKWLEHLSGKRNWQYALWPVLMWQAFFDEVRSPRDEVEA